MTTQELSELVDYLINWAEKEMDEAFATADKRVKEVEEMFDQKLSKVFKKSGVTRCPDCQGRGRIRRPDSNIMRKFRMREWDGCKRCGGTRETKGRRFLTKE